MKATHTPPPPAAVEPTPADILRCAARYLQRHGWIQGDYYTIGFDPVTPRACVTGAIGMATYGTVTDIPFLADHPERANYHAALWALVDFLDLETTGEVFEWNDTPGRTCHQVITALTRAADAWEHTYLHPAVIA